MSEKQVMVPEKLIYDVFRLCTLIDEYEYDNDTRAILEAVEAEIGAKMRAMKRRMDYAEQLTKR